MCEQNTDEWLSERLGIPTASAASSIITGNGQPSDSWKKYAHKLAWAKHLGRNPEYWAGNKSTEFGHEHEPAALRYFGFCKNLEYSQIGFARSKLGDFGCSPDSVVTTETSLVECKCFPERHIEALNWYQATGLPLTSLIPQLQFQMLVMGATRTYLVHYLPDMPGLILPVDVDPMYQLKLKSLLLKVVSERNIQIAKISKLTEMEHVYL